MVFEHLQGRYASKPSIALWLTSTSALVILKRKMLNACWHLLSSRFSLINLINNHFSILASTSLKHLRSLDHVLVWIYKCVRCHWRSR